jgi:hypothetical protein
LNEKNISIQKTTLEPVLDGILDDAIWQQASLITDLHQVNPIDHGTPSLERYAKLFLKPSPDNKIKKPDRVRLFLER